MPHDKEHVLADVHQGNAEHVQQAIDAAATAWADWSRWPWEERAAVFLRAAELLAGPWRDTLNAATMLGQSKTAHQAEIDAACESIDFFRFNVEFMTRIYAEQPISSPGIWNRMEYRPLEGFVFAVSPFNFTAIAREPDELARADGQRRRLEAGRHGDALRVLPDAPLPGGRAARRRDQPRLRPGRDDRRRRARAARISRASTSPARRRSSTACGAPWRRTWSATATTRASSARPAARTSSSRIPSADVDALATAIVRGSFEYQGQKCSASSRVYAPSNLWPELRERLQEQVATITMGDVSDFGNFMGAVIDSSSFKHAGATRSRRRRRTPSPTSSSAAATTTRRATSSSRR